MSDDRGTSLDDTEHRVITDLTVKYNVYRDDGTFVTVCDAVDEDGNEFEYEMEWELHPDTDHSKGDP